jgi:TonB family protein
MSKFDGDNGMGRRIGFVSLSAIVHGGLLAAITFGTVYQIREMVTKGGSSGVELVGEAKSKQSSGEVQIPAQEASLPQQPAAVPPTSAPVAVPQVAVAQPKPELKTEPKAEAVAEKVTVPVKAPKASTVQSAQIKKSAASAATKPVAKAAVSQPKAKSNISSADSIASSSADAPEATAGELANDDASLQTILVKGSDSASDSVEKNETDISKDPAMDKKYEDQKAPQTLQAEVKSARDSQPEEKELKEVTPVLAAEAKTKKAKPEVVATKTPSPVAVEKSEPVVASTQPKPAVISSAVAPTETSTAPVAAAAVAASETSGASSAAAAPVVGDIKSTETKAGSAAGDATSAATPISALPTGVTVRDATDLVLKKGPNPTYPIDDRANNRQGQAVIVGKVKSDGSMGEVFIERSTGSRSLDNASLDAFKKWKFEAGQEGYVRKPFEFRLKGDSQSIEGGRLRSK